MAIVVKQVVQMRLLPTHEQAIALRNTLHICNTAASWLSEQMHTAGIFRKFDVHKRFYAELRERFGLAAQPAIRVIGKTVDAYTTLRANLKAGNYGPPGSDRRSQASFICGRCGFVGHADHNAAHNIAQRGVVCWGEVMRPHAAPVLAAGQDGSSKPIGTPERRVRATSPFLQGRVHYDLTAPAVMPRVNAR